MELSRPGNTPLLDLRDTFGVRHLFAKDESRNPTHTFKDRLAFEMLNPITQMISSGGQPQRSTFASISYGNTALSLGYYCRQMNECCRNQVVNAVAFMPSALRARVYGPDTSGRVIQGPDMMDLIERNCTLLPIELGMKTFGAGDLEEMARTSGCAFEAYVDVTEGLDRPSYDGVISEIVEQQLQSEPDYVIVPFGAGILCNEIIDYIQDHGLRSTVLPISSGDPDTIAMMLYGPIWVNVADLLAKGWAMTRHEERDKKGRSRTPYVVYHVDDNEILAAMKVLEGKSISCEPSAASGFAILHRLKGIVPEFDPQRHSVVVISTGNSLLNFDRR